MFAKLNAKISSCPGRSIIDAIRTFCGIDLREAAHPGTNTCSEALRSPQRGKIFVKVSDDDMDHDSHPCGSSGRICN